MTAIRYRTAPTLTIVPHAENQDGRPMVGIYEFISNSFAYCSADALVWLSLFKDWKKISEANEKFPQLAPDDLRQEVEPLIDAKFIAIEGSVEAQQHDHYSKHWELGYPAALFHFSTVNSSYYEANDEKQEYIDQLVKKPRIPLNLKLQTEAINLGDPFSSEGGNLLKTMACRRTNRTTTHQAIDLQSLSACLFAGLGITGFLDEKYGMLPLSMTPSGGARNPYEAFVFVKRITNVEPGLYHYSALDHQLEFLSELAPETKLASCFGNQDWVDEMAVVVVLVAFMERTAWKYNNASAYRVIYLEAGHIAQNAILMATSLGLTACPKDATIFAKRVAHYICTFNGGHGAFRDFAELIISANSI